MSKTADTSSTSSSTSSSTFTKSRPRDSHKYIPTTYKTQEDILPHEIRKGDIEESLLIKLRRNYEGRTIKDGAVEGFIKKNSLTLQERSRGFYRGAHFTGHMTYDVQVHFQLYVPVLNTQVYATVRSTTDMAFIAVAHPLRIMVVRNSTFQQANDLFDKIRPGLRIPIEILHFEARGDHFYTIGRLMEYTKDYEKTYPILIGQMQLNPPQFFNLGPYSQVEFVESFDLLPLQEWKNDYGDPDLLNAAKEGLADPDDPYKVLYYERFIKQLLNDYEIVGNNKYFGGGRYSKIFQLDPMPCSRAYFKLTEILKDFDILEDIDGDPMEALLLAEAPGGFIHALMNARATMNVSTGNDFYRSVTAPRNPDTGVRQDWDCNNPASREFLGQKVRAGVLDLVHGDLTDPKFIRQLIALYDSREEEERTEEEAEEGYEGSRPATRRKANILTADGGIDVATSDNYNFQEMMNYKLFYGEILAAIGCQAKGGHFILKMYDAFTKVTNQLIQLLAHLWSDVQITKPKTSRPANSERYIVCMGFRGKGTFPLEDHLDLLNQLNNLEANALAERGARPTDSFIDRGFFLTSLIDMQLDDDVTTLLNSKNEIFVARQMETIKEGTELLKKLRNPNISMKQKEKLIEERLSEQIRNAVQWCQDYLPAENCKGYPAMDMSYFASDQRLRADEARTVGNNKSLPAILRKDPTSAEAKRREDFIAQKFTAWIKSGTPKDKESMKTTWDQYCFREDALPELRGIAKSLQIENYSQMNKEQLCQRIAAFIVIMDKTEAHPGNLLPLTLV